MPHFLSVVMIRQTKNRLIPTHLAKGVKTPLIYSLQNKEDSQITIFPSFKTALRVPNGHVFTGLHRA